ncbi:MAG: adenine phosphoribosyltransferase [Verrucomicrobiae bacterium]|nr:adenine phosphoribosyltransferase [Verrucomicrobiae bacterium]
MTRDDIKNAIRNIPDFPQPGIQFKDITPVLGNYDLFNAAIKFMREGFNPGDVDVVVGIDARGFIFAAAIALELKVGMVPVRKKGKLPFITIEQSYELEYGSNTIAVHVDAFKPGNKVLLVDDLLATGGTAAAAAELVKKAGGSVVGVRFLIELSFLNGREKLNGLPVDSVVIF